jgi:CPA2 family monovalent cation:H+ antiporter-2
MHDFSGLYVVLILLAAAVLVVAVFKRLNLSPVLGYLAAGAMIGPSGFAIVKDVHGTATIAEFGVVFLLFVIGLELSFERLKAMRSHVFGLGSLQVLLTALVIGFICSLLGFSNEASLIIGFGLAFSSTALVLQVVKETGEKSSQVGRLSLAILILQDLAVLPLLVLVPLLAESDRSIGIALTDATIRAAIALVIVFIAGRIFLRPLFRQVTALNNPEIFTALTLLIVLGISFGLYKAAGLSLAFGAFIAGLLVAETEYKHQVEADIMPYKSLLLGLFFMAVGMQIDLTLVQEQFFMIVALCIALMIGKTAIIALLCRMFKFSRGNSIHTGLLLSQGGEFGFILFQLAAMQGVITVPHSQVLLVVVTTTMALTPLFANLGKRIALRFDSETPTAQTPSVEIKDITNHVIILGFGRVGQTLGKLLAAENIPYVAIDGNSAIASTGKKSGFPVYFGDGTRREILNGMGIEHARSVAITVNDFESAQKMLAAVRALDKDIPVVARSRDLRQLHHLEMMGANVAISDMFEASIELGAALLRTIGVVDNEVTRITKVFRDKDYALARQSIEMQVADRPHAPKLEFFAFKKAKVYHSIGATNEEKDK